MSMFCFQCQEASKGTGCKVRGICGKPDDVANLQDLLIYTMKGISLYLVEARKLDLANEKADQFIMNGLFSTITNANFNKNVFVGRVRRGLQLREEVKEQILQAGGRVEGILHDAALWKGDTLEEFEGKALKVGVLATENEDIRSLRELITYGLKGMAAYAAHA